MFEIYMNQSSRFISLNSSELCQLTPKHIGITQANLYTECTMKINHVMNENVADDTGGFEDGELWRVSGAQSPIRGKSFE